MSPPRIIGKGEGRVVPYVWYAGVWRIGGIALLILNLGTRYELSVSLPKQLPMRKSCCNSLNRRLGAWQRRFSPYQE